MASETGVQVPPAGTTGTVQGNRRLGRLLVGIVSALVLATVGAEIVFGPDEEVVISAMGMVAALVYAGVGATIVSRHRRHTIGWLLWGIGVAIVSTGFAEAYLGWAAERAPGLLPGARWVAWSLNWTLAPILESFLVLLVIYPTGRPPSRRWRWLLWAIGLATVLGVAGFMLDATRLPVGNANISVPNPTGVDAEFAGSLLFLSGMLSLACLGASLAALVLRFRRSRGEERQQIRWLVYAAALGVSTIVAMFVSIWIVGDDHWLPTVLFTLAAAVLALAFPAACWVAVLRHGLYQLDVVVKRTVLYSTLALLIVAAGAAVFVVVAGTLTSPDSPGRDSPLALLLAGVAIGVLVIPLRRFATRVANRVVYGRRATPYEVLTEFGQRVGGTYSTEDVLARMAQLLGQATGATAARVWLRVGAELRPEASFPPGAPARGALPTPGDHLPPFPAGEAVVEVRHQGELLGAVSVLMPPSDPINPAKEKLLRDLAGQAGLVLRNVRLIEELRASRQRLVAAQDTERRRIERNLHDGAQQQLVALAVRMRLAGQMVDRDPAKAKELLDQLQADTQAALDDLRDLARGIYPPLLADQGLVVALESQARKAPVPVEVRAEGDVGRYGQETEAAVYFCVLEALQNVAKYARASRVVVRLAASNGDLRFVVQDDGEGFDPAARGYGSGLQGMADRLDAIGGMLEVTSAPGLGTTVAGSLPVAG